MSSTIRNLVLLGLIVVMVNSAIISQHAFHQRNMHRIRIQQVAHRLQAGNNGNSSIANTLQSIIDTISASVNPNTPTIIETKNLPVLVFSKDSCQSLTNDQKSSILNKVKTTKDNISAFQDGLTNDKISDDADSSITYLSIIEQLVNKNCDDINKYILIGPTPYQTNIVTDQPWILGDLTLDDITKDYLQRINKYDNVTNCGANTPFWDGSNCLKCVDQLTPVFNVATGKCQACPKGKVYNASTHSCIDGKKTYKPNAAAQTNILVPTDAEKGALDKYLNTGDTECPAETPFVQNNSCISCPKDKPYFNIGTSACEACPEGKTFDNSTHSCIGIKYKPNAASKPHVLVPSGAEAGALDKYLNTGDKECPAETPFVKNNTCVPCPQDKPYFNLVSTGCQSCSNFQQSTNKCNQRPNGTDVSTYTPKLVMNDNSTNDDWNNYVKENEGKVFCKSDAPFWNGKECIQCPALFNIITKQCTECESEFSLNTGSHICEADNMLEPSLLDLFNVVL